MACKGFFECLLKLLNFLMTLAGLAIVGYGIYLFVEFKHSADTDQMLSPQTVSVDQTVIQLGRPMMMAVSMSSSILDNLPKAWYDCLQFAYDFMFFSCLLYHLRLLVQTLPKSTILRPI